MNCADPAGHVIAAVILAAVIFLLICAWRDTSVRKQDQRRTQINEQNLITLFQFAKRVEARTEGRDEELWNDAFDVIDEVQRRAGTRGTDKITIVEV